MALPSFSLQSTSILSDPHWSTLSLAPFPCALGFCALVCFGIYALVRELGKDPSYRRWDRKLAMCSSKGVGKER